MSKIEISHLDRDFTSLMETLKSMIPNLTDDWTDFSDSDLGMFLLGLMASIKDMQSCELDMAVLESMISSCRERGNFQEIVKPLGYVLPSYKSAKISLVNNSTPVNLDDYQVLWNSEEYYIHIPLTDADVANQGEIKNWPSTVSSDSFGSYVDTDGNSIQSLTGYSYTNEHGQVVQGTNNMLLSFPISGSEDKVAIDGTMRIWDTVNNTVMKWNDTEGNEIYYQEVENFIDGMDSFPKESVSGNPLVFRLYVGKNNKTYIEIYDATPLISRANVQFKFLITEGANVNVSAGITVSTQGTPDTYEVANVIYGSNPMPLDEAVEDVQKFARTSNKAVTIEDYEYLLETAMRDYRFSSESPLASLKYSDVLTVVQDGYLQSLLENKYKINVDIPGRDEPLMQVNEILLLGWALVSGTYTYPRVVKLNDFLADGNGTDSSIMKTVNNKRMATIIPIAKFETSSSVIGFDPIVVRIDYSVKLNAHDRSLIEPVVSSIIDVLNKAFPFSRKFMESTIDKNVLYNILLRALPVDFTSLSINDVQVKAYNDLTGDNITSRVQMVDFNAESNNTLSVKDNYLVLLGKFEITGGN